MGILITKGPGAVASKFMNLKNSMKKSAPELLVVGGAMLFAATIVSACKTAIKTKEIVDKANEEVEAINNTPNSPEYTQEDAEKDIKTVKRKARIQIIGKVAVTTALAAGTLTCFFTADHMRKERHLALLAAAEMERRAFDNYRQGVRERYGDDADAELKYKLVNKEWEEEETDPKTGKKKKVKKKTTVSELREHDGFTRIFDEFNDLWVKEAPYNLQNLLQAQSNANKMLRERGFVTVNDVYDLLHFERVRAGQFAGWIWDPSDLSCQEGTHIDFGFWDMANDEGKKRFLLGYERSVILDFNIDTLDVWNGFDDTPLIGLPKKEGR